MDFGGHSPTHSTICPPPVYPSISLSIGLPLICLSPVWLSCISHLSSACLPDLSGLLIYRLSLCICRPSASGPLCCCRGAKPTCPWSHASPVCPRHSAVTMSNLAHPGTDCAQPWGQKDQRLRLLSLGHRAGSALAFGQRRL